MENKDEYEYSNWGKSQVITYWKRNDNQTAE